MLHVKRLLLLALLAGLWGTARTQTQPLSLEDALEQAKAENAGLRAQRAKADEAAADYTESTGVFLPRVSVSETGIFTNSPLYAFGFLLQQERVRQQDFNPTTLNNPGGVQNYLTQVEVQMPLVNINGWQLRKAAKNGYDAQRYRTQYAQENVAYYVRQVYFGIHLVNQQRTVLLQAKEATEAALKYVRDNVEAGYAQRSDELAVQVRLSQLESNLLMLDDQEAYYQDQLSRLLGAPQGTTWQLTDSLETTAAPTLPVQTYDLSKRPDFQAYNAGLAARSYQYEGNRAGLLPSLNAFGQYALYDEVPFGAAGDNYVVGIELKWDLFTGFSRKAGVERSIAAREATAAEFDDYRAQAQAEWDQAWRNLEIQKQEVARARLALSQANEAYRILRDRFEQGLERTFDLLAAEATQSEQALRLVQAQYNLYLAQAKLHLLGTQTQPLTDSELD